MPEHVNPDAVFLNIPYDEEFQNLYLAYITGLYQLGLTPHIASEISGGRRRLDRIFALIRNCRYSIHDLSRVELSPNPSATPRFNMPLELGMTIAWTELNPESHTWSVWESSPYRLQMSTSDLNGTDPNIHNGTVEGILSELRSCFVFKNAPPVTRMMRAYKSVESRVDRIKAISGTQNVFSPAVFQDLGFAALHVAKSVR